MTFLLKEFFSLLRILNSETEPKSIALGICCGFVLGMTPSFSLQSVLIFVFIVFFRVQIGAAFIATFFFSLISFLLDPIFNFMGSLVLELERLKDLYTAMYNMPLIPYTRFNNSLVMGSTVFSFFLFPFLFFFSKKLIQKYRATVVERFQETRFWGFLKKTKIYEWYYKYKNLFNESK